MGSSSAHLILGGKKHAAPSFSNKSSAVSPCAATFKDAEWTQTMCSELCWLSGIYRDLFLARRRRMGSHKPTRSRRPDMTMTNRRAREQYIDFGQFKFHTAFCHVVRTIVPSSFFRVPCYFSRPLGLANFLAGVLTSFICSYHLTTCVVHCATL